jgi:hypothetical protein
MSYVQSVDFGTFFATATAGPSLTSVGSGHGLFAYFLFNNTPTPGISSITDSAGTTWTTSGTGVVTGGGGTLVFAEATSAVASGTHTLTVTYSGSGDYVAIMIEDTLTTLRSAAIGQLVSSPTTGQTLTPGGPVGNSGDLVYMVALTDLTSAANTQPVAGTGGFTIPVGLTSTNINIGAWAAGYNASAGGTTPSMAPGTAGTGEATGVLAFALIAGASNTASIAWVR